MQAMARNMDFLTGSGCLERHSQPRQWIVKQEAPVVPSSRPTHSKTGPQPAPGSPVATPTCRKPLNGCVGLRTGIPIRSSLVRVIRGVSSDCSHSTVERELGIRLQTLLAISTSGATPWTEVRNAFAQGTSASTSDPVQTSTRWIPDPRSLETGRVVHLVPGEVHPNRKQLGGPEMSLYARNRERMDRSSESRRETFFVIPMHRRGLSPSASSSRGSSWRGSDGAYDSTEYRNPDHSSSVGAAGHCGKQRRGRRPSRGLGSAPESRTTGPLNSAIFNPPNWS